MKVVTFSHKSKTSRVGIMDGERIIGIPWNGNMLSLIQSGITPGQTSERFPLEESRIMAPVQPGKIIGIGRNYKAHAEELGNDLPSEPLLFPKMTSSVVANGDLVTWDTSLTTQTDYEGELAVVIGKRAYNVSEEEAVNYIFGYTIANDITARDLQDSEQQWIRAKGLNTFCPLGPSVVIRQEIEDPHSLSIKTELNGEVVQDGNTSDLIFNVYNLIAYCSRAFTLEPGDVILTGTPPGVGKAQDPPRYLKDGDEVSVTIEGIGTLKNTCKVIQRIDEA